MRVVVGLRNAAADYAGTRHNVGAEVLGVLARRHSIRFKRSLMRTRCEVGEWRLGGERVVLAAPLGYMNESGGPVRALLGYFKADVEGLLVLHDDIDLAFGRLRLQVGGGSGGHNGIRSLEAVLGTNAFSRLKIGVGRPPGRMEPSDYVLRRFSKAEREEVEVLLEDAADVVERWVDDPARAQEQAAHRAPGS